MDATGNGTVETGDGASVGGESSLQHWLRNLIRSSGGGTRPHPEEHALIKAFAASSSGNISSSAVRWGERMKMSPHLFAAAVQMLSDSSADGNNSALLPDFFAAQPHLGMESGGQSSSPLGGDSTCVRFIDRDPDPTNSPLAIGLFTVIYLNIFVLGLVGNLSIVLLTLQHKPLRTVQNIFILNLAISDVIVCLLSLPFTPVTNIYKEWFFGLALCHLLPMVQAVSVFVSTFSLSAIAIDRYNLVVRPHGLPLSLSGAIIVATVLWVLSVAVSLPYAYYMVLEQYPGYCGQFCSERWPNQTVRRGYALIVLTLQFLIPFMTMSFCYATIFSRLRERANSKLRKLHERSQLLMNSVKGTPQETERGNNDGGECGKRVDGDAAGGGDPHRGVNSVMSAATDMDDAQRSSLLAQQRRTTTILVSMVMLFGCCWLPQNLLTLLIEYDDALLQSSSANYTYLLSIVTHSIAMFTNVANPILYAWLNPTFKRLFLEAFSRSRFGATLSRASSRRTTAATTPEGHARRPRNINNHSATTGGRSATTAVVVNDEGEQQPKQQVLVRMNGVHANEELL